MGILSGIRERVTATDPGRQRLHTATAVSLGVALSALAAWAVVTSLSADRALLTIGVFLAMQMGLVARDSTATARWITTAWLVVPALAAGTAAALLHSVRWQQLVVFILIAGVGTWARRFGPRATAMGFAAFFGYFFALLLGVTLTQFLPYALVVCGAAGAQTLMRLLLSVAHPQRQLELLTRELRTVSAAALYAAEHPPYQRLPQDPDYPQVPQSRQDQEHPQHLVHRSPRQQRTLRNRLGRLDATAFAINDWQHEFDTQREIGCEAVTLAALVLEARMDVEHVCAELLRDPTATSDHRIIDAIRDLRTVLQHGAPELSVTEATQRARQTLAGIDAATPRRALLGSIVRSTIAHQQLRETVARGAMGVSQPNVVAQATTSSPPPSTPDTSEAAPLASAPGISPNATHAPTAHRWWEWREWRPTTRLALQITIAASLATVVGEAISASRWYWAVLTAFIVFVGTTTRGDILTRAYRRVAGTAAGILVGVVAVWVAHDHRPWLMVICVIAAFGMQYLGPVRYFYSTFFISIMLVSLYGLMGILNSQVLELRIDETAAGAIIGVLCAYLIFSANSHPALLSKLDAYFDSLTQLTATARAALLERPNDAAVLAAVQRLDSALQMLEKAVTAMSAAVLVSHRSRQEPNIHLLYLCTRASATLAQSTVAVTPPGGGPAFHDDAADALQTAFDLLTHTIGTAHSSFTESVADPLTNDTAILDLLPRIPYGATTPQVAVVTDLSRMAWVLQQITRKNAT